MQYFNKEKELGVILKSEIDKTEKDRIFSIQIDHLLLSNSGIFIIETKNWS